MSALPSLSIGSKFRIATLNVRGLSQITKRQELDELLSKKSIDVCCLQETKVATEDSIALRHGHLQLLGQEQGHHRGVGIWVSRRLMKGIQGYKQFGDRIFGVKILFKQEKSQPLVVVGAYGPTSQTCAKNPTVRDRFYSQLSAAVDYYPSRSLFYMAGDFNSKLGAGKVGHEVGRWGKGRQNENGKSLLNFCQQHGLVALNTLFQHHPKHITTWESSFKTDKNRTVRNQIDFVLGRIKQRRTVTQARAYHVPEISTDHRMVVATICSPQKVWFCNRSTRTKVIRLGEIRNDKDKQEQWRSVVSATVAAQEPTTWDEAASMLVEQGRKILGTEQRSKRTQTYFTDDPLVAQIGE
ncbi:PREDICTED: craniofacial development protein 2-like [Branchiostoma belcheri]|uniref:Craniofacial development protein 2-like n=1 Tax=Branchiostoma belcheri TaxID=7741 RepID=A0A6P5AH53_BRABE|nr:PREDICTED: craniofacial development protein 2-like [Branchiostoma belcheri]